MSHFQNKYSCSFSEISLPNNSSYARPSWLIGKQQDSQIRTCDEQLTSSDLRLELSPLQHFFIFDRTRDTNFFLKLNWR